MLICLIKLSDYPNPQPDESKIDNFCVCVTYEQANQECVYFKYVHLNLLE